MNRIALFGAAGKVGSRIVEKLRDDPDCEMMYVESGETGIARLREMEIRPTDQETAVELADVVILAIPDALIGEVAAEIVPRLKRDTMIFLLDPAAPHSGVLPERDDIAYFVTHPCHPPFGKFETDPVAHNDYWGGIARQNIVCALMQGTERHYQIGENLARKIFAPVMKAHRITVEQMAILEPAMAETVMLTLATAMREAVEEAIKRGVPEEAARDFASGHIAITFAIQLGLVDIEVSDAAKLAVERAKPMLLRDDWRRVFEPDSVKAQVQAIAKANTPRRRDENR